ncbi:macrolide 2'-phosphotransferase [Alkalibacterium sp. AK22]|uniref:macrolide 2'-phosphotransferase n=1 Tax=Alkalibacterium sp. AK22 TaxID=1229520 RepID=UPI0004475023|nr:macrolide 2'-phosphotransferase [Alkalibacterium sp. AK22]EXJ22556.1 macrolide 2'-phosphotransferase [Alkalibacterium sp. AK22]
MSEISGLTKKVKNTAARHGVPLLEDSMSVESMGLDFEVLFAKDTAGAEWVCRLPKRADALEKASLEKSMLDYIADRQSVFQVPVWKVFSDELILYKKLNGQPAVVTDPFTQEPHWAFDPTDVPDNYLHSLARALAELHRLPLKDAEQVGFKITAPNDLRLNMQERMKKIKEDFPVHEELWARWMNWVNDPNYWPRQVSLVHGDLFPGHTLIDDHQRVCGLIDWTESEGNDASVDFTAVYMLFGEAALDQLLLAYQAAGGYVWTNMKAHIIERLSTQAITIAEFAELSGLKEYREMAARMLEKPS